MVGRATPMPWARRPTQGFGGNASRSISGRLMKSRETARKKDAGRPIARGLAIWHRTTRLFPVPVGALALALQNRLGHTPAAARGEPDGESRLAASIRLEIVFVLLAFRIAAEMVSVHPIDYGHRVQN